MKAERPRGEATLGGAPVIYIYRRWYERAIRRYQSRKTERSSYSMFVWRPLRRMILNFRSFPVPLCRSPPHFAPNILSGHCLLLLSVRPITPTIHLKPRRSADAGLDRAERLRCPADFEKEGIAKPVGFRATKFGQSGAVRGGGPVGG